MRCRMRCGDIWRCGGPIKKYVPVDSIGIEGRTQEMTFDSQVPPYSVTYSISISPSDATKKDVRIESNNPSIISVDSVESDQVTFTIHNEGDARVRITSLADADISDEYSVSVVTPSGGFAPNNGIFVDVDTEGAATGRKRETKATAMGDRFTARVFILKEESEDYVLLEWIHGGDVSKAYVGAANEAHTRAMFTEETTDKLARTIETLWDDGQIANGFVKFTDETWVVVEQFYSTPLTSESIEELQETLASDDIVTLPETYFDDITVRCDSKYDDISGGVGDSKNIEWRGIPETPGTHDPIMFEIGDESIVSITDVQIQPEDEQYSERYSGVINFLKKGETTITFYSANNPRGTLKEVHIITTSTGAYYYINLHQDEFPGNVEAGQTTICKAEVEDYRENDTLAASDYDDSIAQITFQRKAGGHEGWLSNWDIHITGLQAGETVARIHSVNDPEVYEDLLITVSEPIPPVPVESIGAPSIDTIDTQEYRNPQEITFSYLPIDADDMSNIVFNSTNSEVARIIDAGARKTRYENGICTFYIKPGEAGTATVSYSLGGTTYNVYVHVTAPQIIPLQSISSPGGASIAVGEEETINFALSPSNATVELGDFDVISMEEQSVGITDVQLENGVLSVTVTGFTLMCGASINVDYLPSEGAIYASCYVDSYANVTISSDGELFQHGEPCDNPSTVTICDNQASWSLTNGALNVNGEEFHGGADATTWTMDGAEISDGDSGEITGDVTFNIGAMLSPYTITIETEAKPENTVINYCINETWTYEAPESDFPMTFDFSEPISLSYQSDVIYCGALLDNGSYQFWGTYEDNSVHIEMNGEPLSNGDEITIDSDTTLKFVWDPPAPERCPASLVSVWGDDSTISIGETTAVVTNFTTTAECENVDYSNIVATSSSNIVTTNVDINDRKVYVTGVSTGQCTITFSDGDNSWTFNVTVQAPTPPAYATISSGSENVTLQVNGDVLKTLYYSPSDADTSNITLTNSDSSVASGQIRDMQAGLITLSIYSKGEGQSAVTISDGTNSYVYNVTVTAPTPPAHATISSGSENVTMAPGDNVVKRISFSPSNADTSNITWTNSDSNVANGSQQLLLEGMCDTAIDAHGEGTCTVTVSDGTNSYVYNVTVEGAEPEQGQLMFECNSREFGSLIGPDGETWDWDTPYTFELGTQVIYNGENLLTIGEDVFSLSHVFSAPPESIDIDGNVMEIDVPYELSGTEGSIHIEFYYEPIGGDEFNFVDNGEGYYVGNSEFNFNGPSSFIETGYVVENTEYGTEIENAIVTITGDGSPYYVEVKVPTGDVNPGERVRIVRRTEDDGWELGELAGNIPSTQSYTFTINVENLPRGADIDNGEESLEDFPIILDIPSGGSFNGVCNSHDGDGDLNVTIYDTPDGNSEGVVNMFNIGCDGYKPSFEAVGFDLEDDGLGGYNFKKDDNYQIAPDSNVSLTISFTPVE